MVASRAAPGLSADTLASWLRVHHPELVSGSMSAELLAGGRSNLSYLIDAGDSPMVLRRPPLGHVLSTAHDMAREYRVISALHGSKVPVPEPLVFVDDGDSAAGVGAPFYLMRFVDGQVLRARSDNDAFTAVQLAVLSDTLIRTLADLHLIQPEQIGLDGLGRPLGFLERQLHRWGVQYERSKSRELSRLDLLQRRLREKVPSTQVTSLIHGDYRLDNVIVRHRQGGQPSIAAVLDWEMATVGDSFTDLGLLGLYWDIREVAAGADELTASAVDPAAGYPSFAELVETYADYRGIRVPDLGWYRAFAAFKLAVIVEGINFRYRAGQTLGDGFAAVGSLVAPLGESGLRSLDAAAGH